MKKNIVGIICFIALFIFVACSNNAATTPTPIQTPTVTHVPATATTTMSAGFASLLSTETSIPTPAFLTVTAFPITGTPQPPTNGIIYAEEEEIKNVIRDYFDLRYYTFSTLNPNGLPDSLFDDFLSNEPETSVFLELELAKLRMTLKHYELNNLKYEDYEYFLDYENVSFDPLSEKATVSLSKRENVIHEISVLLTSGEPIMSSGYNERHTIILHKEGNDWKIVSDEYRDYVWRMLKESGASTDEILRTLNTMLENAKAAPRPSALDCFRGDQFSTPVQENTTTSDAAVSSSPKIKNVYLNGKRFDPEWSYSFPFTNLYFESDGESVLRFIVEVELDDALGNQLTSPSTGQANAGWQIVIRSHTEGEKLANQPTLVLNKIQEINCDSRAAFLVETSLEKIQKELGNHRVFDYQVVNESGDIKLVHGFYLNPYGSYLISDTFGDVDSLDGGIIGYPNLMDESKAVFPRERKAILVHEPHGGFFQLHYLVRTSNLQLPSGIWTEETSDGVIVQIFSYREDGVYNSNNSYTLPDDRKIREKKNYNFEVYFTVGELRESLGEGNEFYIRFLDKDGNFLGEDYFYFDSYPQSTP